MKFGPLAAVSLAISVVLVSFNLAANVHAQHSEVHPIVEDNDPPKVWMTHPEDGARFVMPEKVLLSARAHDPDGRVVSVEFFSGTHSLGVVTRKHDDTALNSFQLVWPHPPEGFHVLSALATDNDGASSHSHPVRIYVEPQTAPAVVSVRAVEPHASKPGHGCEHKVGKFVVSRSHDFHRDLTVFYTLGGTASNGSDYRELPGQVVIRSGHAHAVIEVVPPEVFALEGNVVGHARTVVLKLETPACIAVYPPPPECYRVGTHDQATVFIKECQPPGTHPNIQLVEPADGDWFTAPANIRLRAQVTTATDAPVHVEFFEGHHLIGRADEEPYRMVWHNVPAGFHTLRARATGAAGEQMLSHPVRITVRSETHPHPFVKRHLPLLYVPETPLTVRLRAEPWRGTTSHTIMDQPPAGWRVNIISGGGELDEEGNKVVFGPFEDELARTLIYEVTPPPGEHGTKRFHGVAEANGHTTSVGGRHHVHSAPPHPADRPPSDFVISDDELEAYADAWRACQLWPRKPNPIPVSFATRAGFLSRSGGAYTISSHSPTPFPPLLWVPVDGDEATSIPDDDARAWKDDETPAIGAMPEHFEPGTALTVTIQAQPGGDVKAWAVEERPPHGWRVSHISDDGVFCHTTGRVKWGLFLDAEPRGLSYRVTPETTLARHVGFAGVISLDGVNHPIGGRRHIEFPWATDEDAEVHPRPIQRLSEGQSLIRLRGEPGKRYLIEAAFDLDNWHPLDALLGTDGTVNYIDTEASGHPLRFYRLVPADD